MGEINELIEQLELEQNIRLEDIPNIDLYMDQVIQMFEKTFSSAKRYENDKILTKTMINNYAKGKLFPPVKNKRYTKEQIIFISLIYQLKGGLSIGDIKVVLEGVNEKVATDDFDLESFYQSYLQLFDSNASGVKETLKIMRDEAHERMVSSEIKDEKLEKILFIASLVNMSNLYRKAAETLVDTLGEAEPQQDDSVK